MRAAGAILVAALVATVLTGSSPVWHRAARSPAISQASAVTPAVHTSRLLLHPIPEDRDAPDPVPVRGSGTFAGATGGTPKVGDGRRQVTYQVQVEGGIPGWTSESFATEVDGILADTRSWRASHRWSFHRVSGAAHADLYIRLATPATVQTLCGHAGVRTLGQYSCRYGTFVMINLARWTFAVPEFRGDIAAYRAMVVNHEVGHFLGYGHMACSGPGRLAPVMQTQTIALRGCVPNPWPYPDGVRLLAGRPAPA